ncbi:MAG: hypothetical protein KJ025_18660 [Burkholderiales bacterium]|nr:hypothetical protein [Burkholderiales bacterium]
MKITETEQALLAVVEASRRKQVDAILGEADERARAILREAHERARRAVRTAFLEARVRTEERMVTLQARVATARRLHDQQRAAEILAAEWDSLPAALAQRWRDPAARRRWAEHAARGALGRLPREGWRIAHPADWPEEERAALAAALAADLASPPAFVADASIKAGVRIGGGHNVVDATLDGLLADRDAIGAQLLSLTEGIAK